MKLTERLSLAHGCLKEEFASSFAAGHSLHLFVTPRASLEALHDLNPPPMQHKASDLFNACPSLRTVFFTPSRGEEGLCYNRKEDVSDAGVDTVHRDVSSAEYQFWFPPAALDVACPERHSTCCALPLYGT